MTRHPYQQDPQSGAGNCSICNDAEHTTKHPHVFRLAWKQPKREDRAQVCVCGEPQWEDCHVLASVSV